MSELQHNLLGGGGRKIWRAIASVENFFETPGPSRSHILGDQNVFATEISVQKHYQIAIKHLQRSPQLITETVVH